MFKQPARWLVAVCTVALAIAPVRADMCSPPWSGDVSDSSNPLTADSFPIQPDSFSGSRGVVSLLFTVDRASGLVSGEWALSELVGDLCPTLPHEAHSFRSSDDGEVLELPPLPGSAGLFMSAMLSVGGWHLLCSTRHTRLGSLPEWYHTGGPLQIGHTVVFNMDVSCFRPCCFEQPVGEHRITHNVWYDKHPCRLALLLLKVQASRAPPRPSS